MLLHRSLPLRIESRNVARPLQNASAVWLACLGKLHKSHPSKSHARLNSFWIHWALPPSRLSLLWRPFTLEVQNRSTSLPHASVFIEGLTELLFMPQNGPCVDCIGLHQHHLARLFGARPQNPIHSRSRCGRESLSCLRAEITSSPLERLTRMAGVLLQCFLVWQQNVVEGNQSSDRRGLKLVLQGKASPNQNPPARNAAGQPGSLFPKSSVEAPACI